jgi:serine/threonine protein kinase
MNNALQNLLLDAQGDLKISDFGMATLYVGEANASGEARTELLHTTCGTPNYVAPEVLTCQGYDGHKADVWSMGVILFVLLAGYLPFEESTTAALFKKIKTADFEYPDWFTPGARALLDQVLVVDPNARLSLAELASHPWMKLDEEERAKLTYETVDARAEVELREKVEGESKIDEFEEKE